MISHVNFSSKLRNTNVLNSNVKNKKDNDKSSFENKNLLVMGLGALAISGIAFVMINKLKHPGKTGKDSQQISHKFFKYVNGFENFYQRQDESFQNIIDRQSSLKNEKVLKKRKKYLTKRAGCAKLTKLLTRAARDCTL